MTTAAWFMLTITWSVILTFTGYFFLKVLRTPPKPEDIERRRDGILEKDA